MSLAEYHVEDIECGEHTARIYREPDAENPYDAWDFFSTYAGVIDRGDQVGKGWEELPSDCIEDEDSEDYGEYVYSRDIEGLRKFCSEYKGVIAIPYRNGYYGEVTECDTESADGFVFATPEMIEKEYGDLSPQSVQKALSLLQSEFKTFESWADGDVYGYRVVLTADLEEDDDAEEVEFGSCWGFYGDDYWHSGLMEAVGEIVGEENLPEKKASRLPVMPKVNIASGCNTCLAYCLKLIVKAKVKAEKKQLALQPA